jgi:hypothetical protein
LKHADGFSGAHINLEAVGPGDNGHLFVVPDALVPSFDSGDDLAGIFGPNKGGSDGWHLLFLQGHLRLVEPLEDVAVLSVLGRAAVLLDKTVDVFKACDDALVARGAPALLFRLCEIIKFRAQLVEVEVAPLILEPARQRDIGGRGKAAI